MTPDPTSLAAEGSDPQAAEARGDAAIAETLAEARRRLMAERCGEGHWEGELSSSALSTATAVLALVLARRAGLLTGEADGQRILRLGLQWLADHANEDGGFGDTVDSASHLATTALAWSALGLGGEVEPGFGRRAHDRAAAWLRAELGGDEDLGARSLARGLEALYGEDRTFAVPILTACTLAGAFDDDPSAWRSVPTLPFELAALPREWFRRIGLPVVSYALPALIAIGQVVEVHRPARDPLRRALRRRTRARTLRVLEAIQPANGGFLEATPLTSFVVASLVGAGSANEPGPGAAVTRRGLEFLVASQRADGSWPIDTNLATWCTTLSLGALASAGDLQDELGLGELSVLQRWLLDQQGRAVHPYTGAAPGGWAWTDRAGGVPDADDTAGALLALATLDRSLGLEPQEVRASASAGLRWLQGLVNRDGGVPTFCRGWTKLPFDQSCPDLTAHALRAFAAWRGQLEPALVERLDESTARAARYLVGAQDPAGSWTPLWFGNQAEARQRNPLYGTARVLRAAGSPLASARFADVAADWWRAMDRGVGWLRAAQNADGGFGGAPGLASSVEETGLALEALAQVRVLGMGPAPLTVPEEGELRAAARWLVGATEGGRRFPTRPIGLYFAKLWYAERLYPMVFTIAGLARAWAVLRGSRAEAER